MIKRQASPAKPRATRAVMVKPGVLLAATTAGDYAVGSGFRLGEEIPPAVWRGSLEEGRRRFEQMA